MAVLEAEVDRHLGEDVRVVGRAWAEHQAGIIGRRPASAGRHSSLELSGLAAGAQREARAAARQLAKGGGHLGRRGVPTVGPRSAGIDPDPDLARRVSHHERSFPMQIDLFALAVVAGLAVTGAAWAGPSNEKPPALNFTVKSNDGASVDLSRYRGQVLLIVNTASKCGYTPQYAGLEKLYREYKDRGLRILAFPANDFGHQEPGTDAEIRAFCTQNYNVSFDLFSKVTVKGPEKVPLYRYLTEQEADPSLNGEIKWNFTKFLVDRQGRVVARFEPAVDPDTPAFRQAVEKLLAERAP
jgi:glutathione peroxidase